MTDCSIAPVDLIEQGYDNWTMNRERFQFNSTEPGPTSQWSVEVRSVGQHGDELSVRRRALQKLGSYRVEILIELFLIFACAVLGVAFQFKLMLTLSLFCIAVAIPDGVTGFLLRRDDPERRHGKALFWFFVAAGLMRSATLGLTIFIGSMIAVFVVPGLGGLADVGALTGLLVTLTVFVVIFPVTFVGVWHGWNLPGGVFFCRELTRLRRQRQRKGASLESSPIDLRALNPASSLKLLAACSSISASIFSLTVVLVGVSVAQEANRPDRLMEALVVITVMAQFVIPIAWFIAFCARFVEPWQVVQEQQDERPLGPDEIQYL